MPYKKLAVFAITALLMPLLGYTLNRYVFISNFPYGAFYHTSTTFGLYTFRWLLLAGIAGLFLGLVSPKISLWFGRKDRKTVSTIYGAILITAFTVQFETHHLSKLVFRDEEKTINALYMQLHPELTGKELSTKAKSIDPNIKLTYRDTSSYRRVTGYAAGSTPKYVIEFAYPGFFPKYEFQSRIIVEMSSGPDLLNATGKKVVLLNEASVLNSK